MNNSRSRFPVVLIVVVLLLPVIYLLAGGPLDALEQKGYIKDGSMVWRFLSIVYRPVFWLCQRSESFERLMIWYADLWR